MLYLMLLILVLGIIEIRAMVKKKLIREIWVFSGMAVLAAGLGLYYLADPFRTSFSAIWMQLLGIRF